MKKDINEVIEIPEGVNVDIVGSKITIKKDSNELTKRIPGFSVKKNNNALEIKIPNATKNIKKLVNTFKAHIKNIFQGLNEKFIYKLQICSTHFPITVEKKDNQIIIKNFLGEKKDRIAKILDNTEVKVDKEFITVESHNKEAAGQTAANIESSTRIKNRDRRRFQDGIYITEKAGKEI